MKGHLSFPNSVWSFKFIEQNSQKLCLGPAVSSMHTPRESVLHKRISLSKHSLWVVYGDSTSNYVIQPMWDTTSKNSIQNDHFKCQESNQEKSNRYVLSQR
jgi:hypothetical protein